MVDDKRFLFMKGEKDDWPEYSRGSELKIDAQEYEQIVLPLHARMAGTIWRILRNREETEDVLQEVLLRIVGKFRKIRKHDNPRAFILRMCINQSIDHLRKRQRKAKMHQEVARLQEEDRGDSSRRAQLMQQEELQEVLQVIQGLPQRESEALLLRAVEELPYIEIAQALNCGESTARVLVSRARKRLNQKFSGQIFSGVKEEEAR